MGGNWGGDLNSPAAYGPGESVDDLLLHQQQPATPYTPYGYGGGLDSPGPGGGGHGYGFHESLSAPAPYIQPSSMQSDVWGREEKEQAGVRAGFGTHPVRRNKEGVLDAQGRPNETEGATVEEVPTSRARRAWVIIVWLLTWWCPSVCLTHLGRMKRPDVRMAWREKVSVPGFEGGRAEADAPFRLRRSRSACSSASSAASSSSVRRFVSARSFVRSGSLPLTVELPQTLSSSVNFCVPTRTRYGTRRK